MNLLRRKITSKFSLGIQTRNNSLSLALCSATNASEQERPFYLKSVKIFDETATQDDQTQALKDWVLANELKNTACNITLGQGDYQLLLTEAPEVPEAEMRDAVRWKVKDLSAFPLENSALDIFFLPGDGAKSGKKMVYVVLTEISKVKQLISMVQQAGLRLGAIEISELSLRNLSLLKPEGQAEGRGIGLVQLNQGKAIIYLYRSGNLYLSRQFNLDYSGGLLEEIPVDSFLLEVQRSLDYYERQMGQSPPSVVYVCGENISEDKINQNIRRGLSVPADYLNLESLFEMDEDVEPELVQECVAALGTAIREQVVT